MSNEKTLLKVQKGPINTSNWVTDHLLVGSYPGDKNRLLHEVKIQAILAEKVTVFVSLQEVKEATRFRDYKATIDDEKIQFLNFPIVDKGIIPDDQILQVIDVLWQLTMVSQQIVYLHCYGGHGRSGTVTILYLSRLLNLSPLQAKVIWIQLHAQRTRKTSPAKSKLTKLQLQQIQRFEETWKMNH